MSASGAPNPGDEPYGKPPSRRWNAAPSFWDFKLSHWVTALLTAALIIGSIVQISIYNRQAAVMKAQNIIATGQASLAQGQDEIAAKQLSLTIANERPYVTMNTMDAIGIPVKGSDNPQWIFSPLWSNLGSTPTRNLTINIRCFPSDTSRLNNIGNYPELSEGDSASFLGPKVNQEIGTCTTRGDYLRLVKEGTSFFYVLGRADYTDTWEGPSYITEFCAEMHVIQGDPGILNSGIIFRSTLCSDAFNCADEECIRQRRERSSKKQTEKIVK